MQSEVGHVASVLASKLVQGTGLLSAVLGLITTSRKNETEPAPETPPTDEVLTQRNAVLSAFLYATADLTRTADPDVIIQGICDAMISASPHIKLVWAWYGEPDIAEISPKIYAGPASKYAETLTIKRNFLTLKGPAFRALLAEQDEYMGVSRMSLFGPWRAAAKEFGFAVAAAFPLRVPDSTKRGILIFYADDKDYFEMIGLDPFKALSRVAEASLTQADLRKQLELQADTDALTGLHNRRYIDRELERLRAMDARHGIPYTLLLIDIDHFKRINDTFGHPGGDAVLVRLSGILRQQLRNEDFLARWGGEEFLCALPNASLADGMALAERIRQIVELEQLVTPAGIIRWTVSIGVAPSGDPCENINNAFRCVDEALYAAKFAGRNRVMQPI
jgi:diguanylate cyclase (GGDEF)-like protein